jgi:hypothetical protein
MFLNLPAGTSNLSLDSQREALICPALHNAIYKHVNHDANNAKGHRFFSGPSKSSPPRPSSLALSQVCRRKYSEYRDTFLASQPIVVVLAAMNNS